MTTCLYNRITKTIGTDSQNTDSAGTAYRCNKIERLGNGSWFLGSGHLNTIGVFRRWAEMNFDESYRPPFDILLEDPEEYASSCLIISAQGDEVWLVDEEMEPFQVLDDVIAIGSGGPYAIAAMDAFAMMGMGYGVQEAVQIACNRDINSCLPVVVKTIGEPNDARN